MGNTAPLSDLESIVAHVSAVEAQHLNADTEEKIIDGALYTAFALRGSIPLLEEEMEIPDTIHAAMLAYDTASWNCTPSDPYGGEAHQALVTAAINFLYSIEDLEEPSLD